MAPPPTLDELIQTILREADSGGALDRLAEASMVVNQLSDTGDAVLGHFVDAARRDGRSWVEISNVLGVTKQAVHKRFAGGGSAERRVRQRFTERARRAVGASSDIARGFQHDVVGTEHILLALFADPASIAAKVLTSAGVDRDAVAAAVLEHAPRGVDPVAAAEGAELPMTERATHVLTLALEEAGNLGHDYVGTEHLLLALYVDPESVAATVLAEVGPNDADVRARVIETIAEQHHPKGGA